MTAANAHAVLTGGAQQLGYAAGQILIALAVLLGPLAAVIVAWRLRHWRPVKWRRLRREELDVPAWVREPSPVVTHHDAMRRRPKTEPVLCDGVTEAIELILKEADGA